MSAQDNLNRDQFPEGYNRISIDKIMRMPSVDALDRYGPGTTFKDIAPAKRSEIDYEDEHGYYSEIRDGMHHYGQTEPIHIGRGRDVMSAYKIPPSEQPEELKNRMMVGNGGHRILLAQELGWTHMAYTNKPKESGFYG